MRSAGEYHGKGEMMMKSVEYMRFLFSSREQEEPSNSTISNQPKGEPPKRSCDWSMMPRDVSNLIAEKIFFPPALRKFAAACKEWCSTAEEMLNFGHTKEPLFMLPFDKKTKLLTLVRLKDFKIYNLKMPQLSDRWLCGVSNGCIVTIDVNLNLLLFNLFKRTQLPLPLLDRTVCADQRGMRLDLGIPIYHVVRNNILKVALSDNPSSSTNCHVAIITDVAFKIAVCKLGYDKWTVVSGPPDSQFDDITFYQGKICAVRKNRLLLIDYHDSFNFGSESIPTPMENIHNNSTRDITEWKYLYLVVLSGQLLLVERFMKNKDDKPTMTYNFKIYRFEKNIKSWSRVYTLGDQSLFLGMNKTISISTKEMPWCKPNCIYFLNNCPDDYFGIREFGFECDNGLFSLDDSHIEYLNINHSTFFWETPAVWCM